MHTAIIARDMISPTFNCLVILFRVGVSQAFLARATSTESPVQEPTAFPGFYRLEVLVTNFESRDGTIYNGQYCDSLTECDPIIYGIIDIDDPDAWYPGSMKGPDQLKGLLDYQLLASASNRNYYAMNAKLIKKICQPIGPEGLKVNVRAEVKDHDFLSAHDLIDEFDCRFTFHPQPGNPTEQESADIWAPAAWCRATNRPDSVSLTYRWRAYPISPTDCV